MNLSIIIDYKYPGALSQGLVCLGFDNGEFKINAWNIPDVPQETVEELMAFGLSNERLIEIYRIKTVIPVSIQALVDKTAFDRNYGNAVAIASYVNSTNPVWKNEAEVFIAWRDAVWNYLYALYATLETSPEPLPSEDEILAGVPIIQWPN